ncbi:hypothetical protein ACFVGN_07050 [Streptomyces sp. NPDC057757]|uniref:hypothetical protein n=1 Tax=Streptomyces sp. NPDC057757 TaxID=3346241 RepID=UPI00368C0424
MFSRRIRPDRQGDIAQDHNAWDDIAQDDSTPDDSARTASPFDVLIGHDGRATVDGEPLQVPVGEPVHVAVLDMLHRHAQAGGGPVQGVIFDRQGGEVTLVEVAPDGSSQVLLHEKHDEAASGEAEPYPSAPPPTEAPPTAAAPPPVRSSPPEVAAPVPVRSSPPVGAQPPAPGPVAPQPVAAQQVTAAPPAAFASQPTTAAGPDPVAAQPVTAAPPTVVASQPAVAAPSPDFASEPVSAAVPGTAPQQATTRPPEPVAPQQVTAAPPAAVAQQPVTAAPPTVVAPQPAPQPTPPPTAATPPAPGHPDAPPPVGVTHPSAPENARPDGTHPAAVGGPVPETVAEAVAYPVPEPRPEAVPDELAELVALVRRSVDAGALEQAAALAFRLREHTARAFGPEHPYTLEAHALEAFVAHRSENHRLATATCVELARIRHRQGDPRVHEELTRAAAAWLLVDDVPTAVDLGRALLAVLLAMSADDGEHGGRTVVDAALPRLVNRRMHALTSGSDTRITGAA